ncbi:hypothetical protein HKBW3S09_01014, partial [Candidatus Hakubella thermalkaliphila]
RQLTTSLIKLSYVLNSCS